MKKYSLFTILITTLLLVTVSCQKDDLLTATEREALETIVDDFIEGEVLECTYEGRTVYCATLNDANADLVFYEINGNLIGSCPFPVPSPPPFAICNDVEGCVVIYRGSNHYSGDSSVDTYNIR